MQQSQGRRLGLEPRLENHCPRAREPVSSKVAGRACRNVLKSDCGWNYLSFLCIETLESGRSQVLSAPKIASPIILLTSLITALPSFSQGQERESCLDVLRLPADDG